MGWNSIGNIFNPENYPMSPYLASHASNPVAIYIGGDSYRIFYSGRDKFNRSSVGGFDFDLEKLKVTDVFVKPFAIFGPPESYFSHGIGLGCSYTASGSLFLLFMGWHVPAEGGHWRGEIGKIEVQSDLLTMQVSEGGPMLGLGPENPISLSYPWVTQNEGGGTQMWYGSTLNWDGGNGEMVHTLQRSDSGDGISWTKNPSFVPHRLGTMQAFSRPTVIDDSEGRQEMYFSFRGTPPGKYKIGRAFSDDSGDSWEVDRGAVTFGSPLADWESEMQEYPFVFSHRGQKFMLYNGNSYGATGVGLAIRN